MQQLVSKIMLSKIFHPVTKNQASDTVWFYRAMYSA